jgi:periodic tryptophan protein 2
MTYVEKLLRWIGEHVEESPHMEFDLLWIASMLTCHGRLLRGQKAEMGPAFRGLMKGLMGFEGSVTKL